MQTEQHHVVLLSPTLAAPLSHCFHQGCSSGSLHHLPRRANPSLFGSQPFLQKQAVLAGELGATSWISSKKPGHKATSRSIKGINFLGSYRPSGNNSILISAFLCAGEECRQHPQSHTFPKHLFPGNSTGITIRYCNIIR